MKLTQNTSLKRNSGMTLIELTVVIVILLALIAVLFVGAQAYKRGADKAACTMAQRNVQQACRAYYNLNPSAPAADAATLKTAELLAEIPKCPTTGDDLIFDDAGADAAIGTLFVTCATADHVPTNIANW
jgi:type II secretory pathway pseudopilin PulG